MSFTTFSLFLSITFVVSASPGPLMLGCMTQGARVGIKKTLAGILGACSANFMLAAASAIGLGLIVSQNAWLFTLIKWVGAFYLAYLGWKIIRSTRSLSNEETQTSKVSAISIAKDFFIIAISNPKGLLYFGALYPQFINYKQSVTPQFFILTATFLTTDFIWMLVYALAGKKIMQWLVEPRHQTLFNRFSGGLLITVALFMTLQSNH